MACIVLLALALGYLGSTLLARPLGRLTAAAARIGGGDLESPVPVEGADEVGQLARSGWRRCAAACTRPTASCASSTSSRTSTSSPWPTRCARPSRPWWPRSRSWPGTTSTWPRAEREATIRRIERGAVRLQTLVENVLDAGSIRAGRFTIHPRPADLGLVLDGAAATLQPLLEEKRQRLETDLPAHPARRAGRRAPDHPGLRQPPLQRVEVRPGGRPHRGQRRGAGGGRAGEGLRSAGRGSPCPSRASCSSATSAPPRPPAPHPGPAWAWPSPRPSSRPTGAPSAWRATPGRAPPSGSPSPWPRARRCGEERQPVAVG